MGNELVREFPPQTLDKVQRLLDLLGEFAKGDFAKGDFAKGDFAKGDFAKGGFAKGGFATCPLFGDAEMIAAALVSPEAQWKLQNIRRMPH